MSGASRPGAAPSSGQQDAEAVASHAQQQGEITSGDPEGDEALRFLEGMRQIENIYASNLCRMY